MLRVTIGSAELNLVPIQSIIYSFIVDNSHPLIPHSPGTFTYTK